MNLDLATIERVAKCIASCAVGAEWKRICEEDKNEWRLSALAAFEAIFDWKPIAEAPKPKFMDAAKRFLVVDASGRMDAINWCNQTEELRDRLGYPKIAFYLATDIPLPEVV